jgi:UDP:flavonoid glycosyltransferase YjiC (YdhE family)
MTDVAVILAYGSPALGHFLPLSALLSALTARGHRVQLHTLAGGVTAGRELGFVADRVDPRIEAIESRDWTARNAFDVLAMTVDVLCRRAVMEVDDLRGAIERVRPDALIVDANCWGAMSVADASGLPWSVFSPFTPYLRSRGVPPFGPGLRPLPGFLGRVRDAQVRPVVTWLFDRRMVPRVNAIRQTLSVPPVKSVDELMRRAPLLFGRRR